MNAYQQYLEFGPAQETTRQMLRRIHEWEHLVEISNRLGVRMA